MLLGKGPFINYVTQIKAVLDPLPPLRHGAVTTRLFAAIHFVDTRLFIRNIEMITSCLSNAHGSHIAEQKREPAQNRLVIVAV